jgi:hypothetical protein
MAEKAKREHKSSMFTKLFSEPDKILRLYNAVSRNNYPLETKIEITTLESVLLNGVYNDLSFILDGKLVVLLEHQSTLNPNLPLRLLFYASETYSGLIDHKSAYSSRLLRIPHPEFIVLYNGKDEFPDKDVLKLSDAFFALPEGHKPSGSLELEVPVININKGRNEDIIQQSTELSGYVTFVDMVREYEKSMNRDKAVAKAIEDCAKQGILVEFLEKHGGNVMSMLYADWNIDDFGAVRWEEGKEEGLLKGAQTMLEFGNPPELIAERLNLPLDKVIALQA